MKKKLYAAAITRTGSTAPQIKPTHSVNSSTLCDVVTVCKGKYTRIELTPQGEDEEPTLFSSYKVLCGKAELQEGKDYVAKAVGENPRLERGRRILFHLKLNTLSSRKAGEPYVIKFYWGEAEGAETPPFLVVSKLKSAAQKRKRGGDEEEEEKEPEEKRVREEPARVTGVLLEEDEVASLKEEVASLRHEILDLRMMLSGFIQSRTLLPGLPQLDEFLFPQ